MQREGDRQKNTYKHIDSTYIGNTYIGKESEKHIQMHKFSKNPPRNTGKESERKKMPTKT